MHAHSGECSGHGTSGAKKNEENVRYLDIREKKYENRKLRT